MALFTWNDLAAFSWNNVATTYPSWNSFGGAAERRELIGDEDGQVHAMGVGDGSDNGVAIEGIWEIPLKAWAGDDKAFIPDTFESFFRKTTNPTIIEPSIGTTDTLMADRNLTALNNFDIVNDQRNDIDLTKVGQTDGVRFSTIRQRVTTTTGGVEWLGGILYGEPREISGGPTGGIVGVHHFQTAAGAARTVAANMTGWREFDGTTWNNISGNALTGDEDNLVRFQVFSVSGTYKIIGVNTADTAKIWDGAAGTYSDLGGSLTAIDVSAAANRVMLLISPDTIRISDFNDPETYPAGLTVRLVDSGDLMIGLERMGRTTVGIYGENSEWIARAQLGSFPFRFERLDEQPGPLSSSCIVRDGAIHYYLAEDGNVYRNNAVSVKPVGDAMLRFVRDNLGFTNRKRSHGFLNTSLRTIFWFFP